MDSKLILSLSVWALLTAGCARKPLAVPELSDAPVVGEAMVKDLPEYAPGYGIAVPGGNPVHFEVNIEAEDSPRVQPGQSATAFLPPDRRAISCRVSRVLRGVSEETGQSVAWLTPTDRADVPVNEFVYSNILVRIRRRALTVPQVGVLSRDGKLFVVRVVSPSAKEGNKFEAVEVSTGAASGEDIEILSGLGAGDRVVVQAGVGFLYPDFKSQAGE